VEVPPLDSSGQSPSEESGVEPPEAEAFL